MSPYSVFYWVVSHCSRHELCSSYENFSVYEKSVNDDSDILLNATSCRGYGNPHMDPNTHGNGLRIGIWFSLVWDPRMDIPTRENHIPILNPIPWVLGNILGSEYPWNWVENRNMIFPCGDIHIEIHMGIATQILLGWDGNGNSLPMATLTVSLYPMIILVAAIQKHMRQIRCIVKQLSLPEKMLNILSLHKLLIDAHDMPASPGFVWLSHFLFHTSEWFELYCRCIAEHITNSWQIYQ